MRTVPNVAAMVPRTVEALDAELALSGGLLMTSLLGGANELLGTASLAAPEADGPGAAGPAALGAKALESAEGAGPWSHPASAQTQATRTAQGGIWIAFTVGNIFLPLDPARTLPVRD